MQLRCNLTAWLLYMGLHRSIPHGHIEYYCKSYTVFSERELTFTFAICYRPSVCRLSVTFVHPIQTVQIFGNIYTVFGTLAIHWHPLKISRRSSQGNPSAGELNTRGVVKYSDFGPIDGYISETVQDRTQVSINHLYEDLDELSIGTKIGDLEWPWTA